LEKCDRIQVVVPGFNWDDIGAWSSLDRQLQPDADGNRVKGDGLLLECQGNTCFTDEGLVALFGVENLLVVHSEGVTLVVEKSKAPQLKELVKKVRENPKWAQYI
jgi:mannose-1-phosphate guanylyltransferase